MPVLVLVVLTVFEDSLGTALALFSSSSGSSIFSFFGLPKAKFIPKCICPF